MKAVSIGVIAASSVIPKIELGLGIEHLVNHGFKVTAHPTCYGEHWFYPADDEARANALLEYAFDSDIEVIWCGRGGYGATHLLPFLMKATKKKKPKKKLLIGYSDATALLEFVRIHWGWKTMHAPMPALKTFSDLKPAEWSTLTSLLNAFTEKTSKSKSNFYEYPLQWIYKPKNYRTIQAPLVGGNFSVWNAMIGTPFAGKAKGKILFFEDLQENVARLNRMIHHLEQSGGFKGVKAVVLGDFTDCKDTVPSVFKGIPKDLRNPTADELQPLRKSNDATLALQFIFRSLGERTGIPVLSGVPVGHADNQFSLALGENHTIDSQGKKLKF